MGQTSEGATSIIPIMGTEAEFGISTYPNPVVDVMNVAHNFGSGSYSIISISGEVILKGIVDDNFKQINTRDLIPGIYLLKVKSADGNFVHKFKKL